MMRTFGPLLLVGGLVLAQSGQSATTFDANLVSPNTTSTTPGWYNGTGNPNGGFTVDTENGIELGLRAKLRFSPNVIDSPTDVYSVPGGLDPSHTPNRSFWNYEFSIDLQPNGVGTSTLGGIAAALTITDLDHPLQTATINPLTYFTDDTGFGPKVVPQTSSDWGAQNSENPDFAGFPLAADYNANIAQRFQFVLTVTGANGATLASDTMIVNQAATPEPSHLILLSFAMLIGVLVLRRRNRAQIGS